MKVGVHQCIVVRDAVKLARMKDYTMEDFKNMPPNRVRNLIIAGSQTLMG